MANLGEIRRAAKEKFYAFMPGALDASKVTIPDLQWNRFANDACEELSLRLKYPRTDATRETFLNQGVYDLPGDFIVPVEVKFRKDGDSEWTTLNPLKFPDEVIAYYGNQWDDLDSSVPEHYCFPDKDIMQILPPPNSSNVGSDFLRMTYHQKSQPMINDSDTPEFHFSFHLTVLPEMIAERAHEFIGNPKMADRAEAKSDRKFNKVIEAGSIKTNIKKRMVWG